MQYVAWGKKCSPEFVAKVRAIAAAIGCDPSWLMACMAFESNFDPLAINANSGASGLIQFMPSTAQRLGTSVEAIRAMNAMEQLDLVASYFEPFVGEIKTLSDCYMAILWPAAVGRAEDAPIFDSTNRAYLANRGLDIDHDGVVTKAEATAYVAKRLEEGMLPTNVGAVADMEDTTMAGGAGGSSTGLGDTIFAGVSAIATAVNPIAGILIGALSPLLKEKLNGLLAKHTDQPEIAKQVSDSLVNAAIAATGKSDPLEAVAVARNDPAAMAKIEQTVGDFLTQMAPLFDKMHAMEQAAWASEDSSRAAAAMRVAATPNDDRMGRELSMSAILLVSIIVVALLGLLGLDMYFDDQHSPDPAILTLVSTAIGVVLSGWKDVFGYRFGSSRSSQTAGAILGEIAKGK